MSELPTGWAMASLGDLLLGIETGKSFKCEERPPGQDEVGVIKVSAVTWGRYQEQESKTCLDAERVNPALYVAPGDFLFSRANTIDLVGACVVADRVSRRVMLSDKILRFRFAQDAHKPWVLNLLRSKGGRQQIESLASGNQESMRNIGQEKIQQIQVPMPPEREQARIVAKLDELLSDLDAGVAELKAAQRKLVQYRQSLLKAAVEGALTSEWRARHPPAETGAQLLARILTERRARWEAKQRARFAEQGKAPPKDWQKKYPQPVAPETADLPALPEGWVWAALDQLIYESSYGTSVKCSYASSGTPVLRIPNVSGGSLDLRDMKFATVELGLAADAPLAVGDVLVIRTNGSVSLVGRAAAVVDEMDAPHYFASYLLRLRCIEITCVHRWILTTLSAPSGRHWLESKAASSAGQHNISLSTLLTMPVPLPPLTEQEQALRELDILLDSTKKHAEAVELSIKQSAAQRQNILRAAFAGQLVPQDPADEPAGLLLARIRAERAGASKASSLRRRRTSAPPQPRAHHADPPRD